MVLKALFLEEDPSISTLFSRALAPEGIAVTCCHTLPEGLDLLSQNLFELAFVNRALGGDDGLNFVRLARSFVPAIGIIILGRAGGMPYERITGLESGADDYLTKPLDMRELVVRARRLGARAADMMRGHSGTLLKFLNFTLDPLARTLRHSLAGAIPLTSREFDLLHCLARSGSRPQSRKSLRCTLHGRDPHTTDRTIDTLVSQIRRKLRAAAGSDPVRTIRSQGYAFGASVIRLPHPAEIASRA